MRGKLTCIDDGPVYIYVLVDPRDGAVRYIGKTENIERRYSQHLEHTGPNSYRKNWLLSLVKQKLKPIVWV